MQVPESIGILLDRENWLRSELHDPYRVFPHASSTTPVFSSNEDYVNDTCMPNGGYCAANQNIVAVAAAHMHAADASPKNELGLQEGNSGLLGCLSSNKEVSRGGSTKLGVQSTQGSLSAESSRSVLTVHSTDSAHSSTHTAKDTKPQMDAENSKHSGNSEAHSLKAADGKEPITLATPKVFKSNNAGKLIAFKMNQKAGGAPRTDAVIQLPKPRLQYPASEVLGQKYAVFGGIESSGKLQRPANPNKRTLKGTAAKSENTSAKSGKVEGEVSSTKGGRGDRAKTKEEEQWSKYHREEPPALSIDIPDFDSEHGFTNGFYDPESYTMYIM